MKKHARVSATAEPACRRTPLLPRIAGALLFGVLLHPGAALAQCDGDEILRYHEKGTTVTGIAELCDMEAAEVRDILKKARRGTRGGSQGSGTTVSGPGMGDNDGAGLPPQGLPSGQPVTQCGCWGNVYFGAQLPNHNCQSGYAVAAACPAYCPTGGYMWYAVCR